MKTFFVVLSLALLSYAVGHGPQGAVYFLSNAPTGNKIIAADIAANGTLSFGCAIDAGGNGGRLVPAAPTAPDPLDTQGSIAVHRDAGLLITVNAGSNTVSLFSINRRFPSKLTMIGAPVSSFGDLPIAVTINEEATVACVATTGVWNGVGCYAIHPVDGLIPLPNNFRSLGLSQVGPPNQLNETSSEVVFSADGSKVIVATKGQVLSLSPPTFGLGFIATFDIDEYGILSQSFKRTEFTAAAGGGFPFSLTPVHGLGDVYISADPVKGFDIFDFENGPSDGVAKVITASIPGQVGNCWTAFSAGTGNYYLTDPFISVITEVHINDDLTSTIVQKYPTGNNTAPLDEETARVGNNDFLYVLMPGGSTGPEVWVFALRGPGSAEVLQKWSPAPFAAANGFSLKFNEVQALSVYTKCS